MLSFLSTNHTSLFPFSFGSGICWGLILYSEPPKTPCDLDCGLAHKQNVSHENRDTTVCLLLHSRDQVEIGLTS